MIVWICYLSHNQDISIYEMSILTIKLGSIFQDDVPIYRCVVSTVEQSWTLNGWNLYEYEYDNTGWCMRVHFIVYYPQQSLWFVINLLFTSYYSLINIHYPISPLADFISYSSYISMNEWVDNMNYDGDVW